MSGGGHDAPKSFGTRIVQLLVLVALVVIVSASGRYFPALTGRGETVAALGFLLLAGTLTSELVELVKLPHLTGYLLAGTIAGPHVLHLIGHSAVEDLQFINSLALALIALGGGAELRLDTLRQGMRGLSIAMVLQCVVVLIGMTLVFFFARPLIPFVATMSMTAGFGVALLWGVTAITRSPSAVLGILSQTRATGPVSTFTLSFVMTSDIVVVTLFAACLIVARPLVDPTAGFSMSEVRELGHDLLGSIAIGTTLGLVLAAYIRLVNAQLVLVLLALGFGAYEVIRYLQFDSLLSFMIAGFVVQNLSAQGPKLIHSTERIGGLVNVLFFATAGAHLDLPLVAKLWPVALLLAGSRALITFTMNRVSTKLANDPPMLRKWGWSGLVSQAGLAIGIVVLVEKAFPSFGAGFRALGIATVAMNEVFGPILFKFGLDRAGETSHAPAVMRASLNSLAPPAPVSIRPNPTPDPALAEALTRDSHPPS